MALDDVDRWQLTALLLMERSPMLWFYLAPLVAGAHFPSEWGLCMAFLRSRARRSRVPATVFVHRRDGGFGSRQTSMPPRHPTAAYRDALDRVPADRAFPVADLLGQGELTAATFAAVNRARVELTTAQFPYLEVLS
jgi:hypothetical protein